MNRLDTTSEESLVTRLRALRQNLDMLKSEQLFGSDSVRFHRVFSALAVDVQFNLIGGLPLQSREIRFTPSDTELGDNGLVYRLRYSNVNAPAFITNAPVIERQLPDGLNEVWKMYMKVPSGMTSCKVKLYFFAVCDGTFSIT